MTTHTMPAGADPPLHGAGPSHPWPVELPWWKRTTVYQVYPRSFADSDGDGIGDLRGIIAHLDYLEWLGVETLWLSPFFKSPQADFGYDISDHFAIAPEYGTEADCRALIDAVHARGMKIVLDMVLNHTSDQHPWFLDSRSARTAACRDYYLWRDGRKPNGAAPPNNWRSMLGGSGWHHDPRTDQWYWASFLAFQPDLNYRNPVVKQAMLDVMRHWLREGADGLRLDIFNAIHKDASFADNPFSLRPIPSEHNPDGYFQRALYTQNHPDTLTFAREVRAVVDEFHHPERFVVGEVFGPTDLLRRYCGGGSDGSGLNLVFAFKSLRTPFTAPAFRALMVELEAAFPEPLHPTYVFGNHDRPRSISRLVDDPARARLLATFQLTVRGVPFIYYGEELGLPHHSRMPRHLARDPVAARFRFVPSVLLPTLRRLGILLNRDESRAPMPWTAEPGAGFSPPRSAAPWLPLHPESRTINVAVERADPHSVLSTYHRLLALRWQSMALSGGRLVIAPRHSVPAQVLAYDRIHHGLHDSQVARVFLNFSDRPVTVELGAHEGSPLHSSLRDASEPAGTHRTLAPWEGVVLLHGGDH